MAPALSLPPRQPRDDDAADQHLSQRRALASVDNLASHMEDDMGLQNQHSLAKDSQEMEQILVDLGNSDLAPDLFQAIKTLETGADTLSTGDADAIFPLSGFDLTETIDSESEEDKIRVVQARLERRCAFLQRRLRILQGRTIGKRVAEEVAQTFEKCTRGARKDGAGRPVGLKALIKRIETTSALQASAASRSVIGPKYYHAGTSKGDASRSASVGIPSGTLTGLQDTAGALRSHLSVVKHELDSDATASSSGAESNDEAVIYNNAHQQHMSIDKRALWTWQRARASVSSRWSWLQAQVQELEYKIRQHGDLHAQVREAKGAIQFEGEPVGYEGSLPGDDAATETCARLRPLRRDTFKKRKLLQMHNLHIATNKAAKPSDVKCRCQYTVESCAVCTGRAEPTEPSAPLSTLSPAQRVALRDPGFHPVLSDTKDISPSIHVAALTSRTWFLSRCSKSWRGAHHAAPSRSHATHAAQPHSSHAAERKQNKKHPPRLKRGRPPLSRKIREREREPRDEESASSHERRGRPSVESRSCRRPSYDIDNIVIPHSVAANTRPQILMYKDILTPKWRVMDHPAVPLNNGVSKPSRVSVESEEEDISEAAVAERHGRALTRERTRYMNTTRTRGAQLDTAAHAALPAPQLPTPPAQRDGTPPEYETVRPYTPREFPLPDRTYLTMLSVMPDGYHQTTEPETPPTRMEEDEDSSSSLSPMSPSPYEGDDPDDKEWDPNCEKPERRKSAFR